MEKVKFIEVLNAIDADDVEKVKELVVGINLFTANTFLCYAAESNAINTLKFFLSSDEVDPSIKDNYAIRIAAAKGYNECVDVLAADRRVDKSVLEDEKLKITLAENKAQKKIKEFLDEHEKVVEEAIKAAKNLDDIKEEQVDAAVVKEKLPKVEEETTDEVNEELPEIEEDLEEVEKVEEESGDEDELEELLDDSDNSATDEESESSESDCDEESHGNDVIDRELTASIFKDLGIEKRKKTKQEEEEEMFSEVEKNLQKTVANTLEEATPEYYE